MKTIWKFPLEITDTQFIDLPRGGEVLTVQMQGTTPCLWATVDTEAPTERRVIHIVGTGNPFPDVPLLYLGTVQECVLAWHVFEQVTEALP